MSKHILVVDDEPHVAEVVQLKLESEGFQPEVAGDGPAALAAVAARRPDLILLDLTLPGMDGWEVCARLREDPATANIPIIVVSARGDPADRARAEQYGVYDFVLKPFSPRDLAQRVRRTLGDE